MTTLVIDNKMFQISPQLQASIQKEFNHEIKVKRIKKQLQLFTEMESDEIKLAPLILNNLGISIPFTYTNSKTYHFQIRLDKEYPFNRPQIHSLDHIDYYGQSRDLLGQYLNSINIQWGPSRMLREFIEMIPNVIDMIERNQNKSLGLYYQGQPYLFTQLVNKDLTLFEVEEIISGIIRNKKQAKKIAISHYYILQFIDTQKNSTLLRLQWAFKISDIKNVSADMKTLQIKLQAELKQLSQKAISINKTIKTANKEDFNKFLCLLNPIQMQQNKVLQLEALNQPSQQLLRLYTSLVQHYSVRDKAKYDKYMEKMKNQIKTLYK